jgi:ankyrin repeat protein
MDPAALRVNTHIKAMIDSAQEAGRRATTNSACSMQQQPTKHANSLTAQTVASAAAPSPTRAAGAGPRNAPPIHAAPAPATAASASRRRATPTAAALPLPQAVVAARNRLKADRTRATAAAAPRGIRQPLPHPAHSSLCKFAAAGSALFVLIVAYILLAGAWFERSEHRSRSDALLMDESPTLIAHNESERLLMKALLSQSVLDVTLLLADPLADPNAIPPPFRLNLLHEASSSGYDAVVRLLLADPRVDPNARSMVSGAHALLWAAFRGQEKTARLLLADPRVDVNVMEVGGANAIAAAIIAERYDIAEMILSDSRLDPNFVGPGGITTLHVLSGVGATNPRGLSPKFVGTFLADPRLINVNPVAFIEDFNNRMTPLSFAVAEDMSSMANALLADPRTDIVNPKFYTTASPLFVACNTKNVAMARLLLDHRHSRAEGVGRYTNANGIAFDAFDATEKLVVEERYSYEIRLAVNSGHFIRTDDSPALVEEMRIALAAMNEILSLFAASRDPASAAVAPPLSSDRELTAGRSD